MPFLAACSPSRWRMTNQTMTRAIREIRFARTTATNEGSRKPSVAALMRIGQPGKKARSWPPLTIPVW